MAVKSAKAGSIRALRASIERKGGGNDAYLQRIPADDSITVRFLTEPEEWQSYFEHYDPVMKYFPCSDDCPACTEGNRPAQKYLANALRVEDNRVIPLVIPKTLVTKLLHSYDRYATMVDRDYELIRLGSGLDTEYDRSAEPPNKRNTKGLELLDLSEVLENQLKRAFGDEDEAQPPAKKSRPTGRVNSVMENLKSQPVDDDDDDEDEDAPKVTVDREELEDMSLRELRIFAKSEVGIDAADIRGMDQEALVELILSRTDDENFGDSTVAADESPADDEEEDDDDEDAADEVEEDEEAEDDEELTEDQIRAMGLPQLRKLCGELEIPFKRTDGKNLLIKKILESVDTDEDDEPPF